MKAWLVELKGGIDWRSVDRDVAQPIVQAATRSQALTLSGLRRNLGYMRRDLRAERAPDFDDKPLTDRTYLENGWHTSCRGCGVAELYLSSQVYYDDRDHAYCSPTCRDKGVARRAKQRAYSAVLEKAWNNEEWEKISSNIVRAAKQCSGRRT